jgi:AraC family transcriptional regulator
MNPRIETLHEKKLVGKRMTMSLVNNLTGVLWGKFMPRRKEIVNAVSNDLFSLQIYSPMHFQNFNPSNEFIKWAAVEVSNFENVPTDMESLVLEGGLYVVFDYKGLSNDPSIFQFIYSVWLPDSEYELDDRPHFEVLGDKYKNNDPNSKEEIWIPVRRSRGE